MILGYHVLHRMMSKGEIITNPTLEKTGYPSYGLGEAGYDLQIGRPSAVEQNPDRPWAPINPANSESTALELATAVQDGHCQGGFGYLLQPGKVYLAPSREHFDLPPNIMGICYSKSSLARIGLVTLCTPLEPGWKGYLTVELVNLGSSPIVLPVDSGVLQVVFHEVRGAKPYMGRYQDQPNEAVLPHE